MASSTQGTWVWANSRRWWKTGNSGVLQSMGSQRVRHNWATEQQKQLVNEKTPRQKTIKWPTRISILKDAAQIPSSRQNSLPSCEDRGELTASSWELLQLLAKVTLFSGGPQTITKQGRSTGPDHFHTVNIPLTAVSALELSMELAGTLWGLHEIWGPLAQVCAPFYLSQWLLLNKPFAILTMPQSLLSGDPNPQECQMLREIKKQVGPKPCVCLQGSGKWRVIEGVFKSPRELWWPMSFGFHCLKWYLLLESWRDQGPVKGEIWADQSSAGQGEGHQEETIIHPLSLHRPSLGKLCRNAVEESAYLAFSKAQLQSLIPFWWPVWPWTGHFIWNLVGPFLFTRDDAWFSQSLYRIKWNSPRAKCLTGWMILPCHVSEARRQPQSTTSASRHAVWSSFILVGSAPHSQHHRPQAEYLCWRYS